MLDGGYLVAVLLSSVQLWGSTPARKIVGRARQVIAQKGSNPSLATAPEFRWRTEGPPLRRSGLPALLHLICAPFGRIGRRSTPSRQLHPDVALDVRRSAICSRNRHLKAPGSASGDAEQHLARAASRVLRVDHLERELSVGDHRHALVYVGLRRTPIQPRGRFCSPMCGWTPTVCSIHARSSRRRPRSSDTRTCVHVALNRHRRRRPARMFRRHPSLPLPSQRLPPLHQALSRSRNAKTSSLTSSVRKWNGSAGWMEHGGATSRIQHIRCIP